MARNKCSLDIFWLKDESLEDSANLPEPHVLAEEIADDLRSALEQIESVLAEPAGVSGVERSTTMTDQMSGDGTPQELPLRDLHERHRALTVSIGGTYEEAAAVCLHRHHTPPLEVALSNNGSRSPGRISWVPPNRQTRDAWANETDATRDGAYGCVIAGIEALRGLYAVRRAETGTGADYYIGPAGSGVDDLEDCLRLEVSGVGSGDEREVLKRLAAKVRQARAGNSSLPAVAGVFGFGARLLTVQDVPEST